MAKLSEAEEKALEELLAKREAPEAPANGGRNVDIYVDLSDEAAVERAIGFGLLTPAEVKRESGKGDGDGDEGDGDGDEGGKGGKGEKRPAPRRRGYFESGAQE